MKSIKYFIEAFFIYIFFIIIKIIGLQNSRFLFSYIFNRIGPIIKSFLCPKKPCNKNDDNPTQRNCICTQAGMSGVDTLKGQYCYTDKGKID